MLYEIGRGTARAASCPCAGGKKKNVLHRKYIMAEMWAGGSAATRSSRRRSRRADGIGGASRRQRTQDGTVDPFEARRREIELNVPQILPNWMEFGQFIDPEAPNYIGGNNGHKDLTDPNSPAYKQFMKLRELVETVGGEKRVFPMLTELIEVQGGHLFDQRDLDAYLYPWSDTLYGTVHVTPRLFNEVVWAYFHHLFYMAARGAYADRENASRGTPWHRFRTMRIKDAMVRWYKRCQEEGMVHVTNYLGDVGSRQPHPGQYFGPVEEKLRDFLGRQRRATRTRKSKGSRRAGARPRDSKGRFLPMRRR